MVPIPIREKSVIFASRLSFAGFAGRSPRYADLLQRRYREVRLPADEQAFFAAYPDTLHFVAIVVEDTPDTVAVLPVLARIADASPRLDLHIVPDNDGPQRVDCQAVLDQLGMEVAIDDLDLPLLLIFDEEWQLQEQWGPHPEAAAPYIDGWLERHPEYEALADDDTPEGQEKAAALLYPLVHELRIGYNSGVAAACAAEIRALLSRLQVEPVDEVDPLPAGNGPLRDEDAADRNTTKG